MQIGHINDVMANVRTLQLSSGNMTTFGRFADSVLIDVQHLAKQAIKDSGWMKKTKRNLIDLNNYWKKHSTSNRHQSVQSVKQKQIWLQV